jgi:tRNA A58 N-methylase Trm61
MRQLYRQSESELRPQQRAMFVPDLTEDVLRRAGIEPGMRVLDLGCGAGDTSFLLARLVGPSGLVVGIDPSSEAIDLAEKRATVAGQCYWTRFMVDDSETFVPAEPFDVLIVRLKLLQPREVLIVRLKLLQPHEPLAAFLRFSSHVRAGGVVVLVSGVPCEAGPHHTK